MTVARVRFPALDGYSLGGFLHVDTGPEPRHAVVFATGGGIRAEVYRHFLSYLASHGIAVLAFDYRGIGESRPPKLRDFVAGFEDWAEYDAGGAIAWMAQRYPTASLTGMGHSIGALMIGASDAARKLEQLVLVAPHTGYHGDYRAGLRLVVKLGWRIAGPVLRALWGYFPAHLLGLGEDLPRRVACQWATHTSPEMKLGLDQGDMAREQRSARPDRLPSETLACGVHFRRSVGHGGWRAPCVVCVSKSFDRSPRDRRASCEDPKRRALGLFPPCLAIELLAGGPQLHPALRNPRPYGRRLTRPGAVMRMTPLKLDLAHRLDIGFRPQIMEPMFNAAESGGDLSPAIARIVGSLGFESFMYGLSTTIRPGRDSQVFFYATLPREWWSLYERMNYVEIDPRIAVAQDQCGPAPWDRDIAFEITSPKHHAKLEQFLHDAAAFGIRSGVAWGVRNPGNHGVIVGLNCSAKAFGSSQRDRLARNIGDVLAFGTYFHEFFIRNFVDKGLPSRLRGAALTEREIQVLSLVASGLTADDIALKLDIVARTVRFHVDSARTKMGALNREEAIALVAKAGLISVLP